MAHGTLPPATQDTGLSDEWLPAPGRKHRKRVWAIALVAVLAGLGLWRFAAHRRQPIHYVTALVTRGAIASRVTASGTLSALVTVQVGSQVSGRIAQIFVDYNSPVHSGEVLARLDPQLFAAALAQARANFQAAQAQVVKDVIAAQDLDLQARRAAVLASENLGAKADAQTAMANAREAHAQIVAAQAAVQQARATLDQARINLGYCTIVSPIDGTVISRNIDVGQTVAASLQAPTLFAIARNLHSMQVDTSVSEADIGRLKTGMQAQFTVDAYPDQTFTGAIRQIRNAPQTVENVVTYDVVVDVANLTLELKPGMTANVTFVDAQRNDAVLIPDTALRFHPAAGGRQGSGASHKLPVAPLGPDERMVWKLARGRLHPVPVRLGITDGTNTEVLSGDLAPGDAVVLDQAASDGGQNQGKPKGMRVML